MPDGIAAACAEHFPLAAWRDEGTFGTAVAACFGQDSAVASARAAAGVSFRPNEAQQQLAGTYARALWRGLPQAVTGQVPRPGRVTLVEGATGTGKTLAYLLPSALCALASGRVSVIATNTLALQRQILEEETPTVTAAFRRLSGRALRVAVLQGLGNFVSASAVEALLQTKEDGLSERRTVALLNELAAWAREAAAGKVSGVLRDFLEDRDLPRLPGGIPARSVCLDGVSPPEERAAYLRQREETRGAHVVVVTHAWLLASLRFHRPLVPPPADEDEASLCGACVCDEAHLLPGIAADALATNVSVGAIDRRVAGVLPFAGDGRSKRLRQALEEADSALCNLRVRASALREDPPATRRTVSWTEVRRSQPSKCEALLEAASAAAVTIGEVAERLRHLRRPEAMLAVQDLLADQAQLGDFVEAARRSPEGDNRPRSVIASLGWSPVLGLPRLQLTPVYPGRLIARLWDGKDGQPSLVDATIMTSATLSTPGVTRDGGFAVAFGEFAAFGEARSGNADLHRSVDPERFGTMRVVVSDPAITPPVCADARGTGDEESDGDTPTTNSAWIAHAGAMATEAWATPRVVHTRARPEPVGLPPNVLVLTTSYGDTLAIGQAIADAWIARGQDFTSDGDALREGTPSLLVHRRGTSLSDIAAAYRRAARRRVAGKEGGCVMVTPVGWEGLDLPGLVAHNVITRLPWPPPPDEAEIQVLAERLGNRGHALAVLLGNRRSRMLRKLRQGIGRGIRSASDSCTIWFADPRLPPPTAAQGLDPAVRRAPNAAAAAPLALPSRFAGAYAAAMVWRSPSLLKAGS